MSGYAEPELLSMSIADLEGRETREEVERHIKKIMMQGEDRFETQQRHKDGSLFVEVSAQYRATNGSGHFVAFMHDITGTQACRGGEVQALGSASAGAEDGVNWPAGGRSGT